MGVTQIRSIANEDPATTYIVFNRENPDDTGGPGQHLIINPGDNVQVRMWIPWCDNQKDFDDGHRIDFEALGESGHVPPVTPNSYSVWQSGDYIYYSLDDNVGNRRLVAGNSTINGDRSLAVTGTQIRIY